MTWEVLEGGVPGDAIKIAQPGKMNATGSTVVSPADLRAYKVMQSSAEEPSLDSDESHYVPIEQFEAIEAELAFENISAPTAGDNLLSLPPSIARDDFTGCLGYEFEIERSQVLMSISRPIGSNFSQNHRIGVWDVSDSSQMAEVTVTPSSAVVNGFAVETLIVPVILTPGTYRIGSEEFASGDNWQDSLVVTNYSSEINIIKGVYIGGYAYPSTGGTLLSGYVWPGMKFAEHALNLNIKTSDSQAYEIDWGNGGGYVPHASESEAYGVYTEAITDGHITLRFALGQFPATLYARTSNSNSFNVSVDSVRSINRYNSLKALTLSANTHRLGEVEKLITPGSGLEQLLISTSKDTYDDSIEWGELLGRANLVYANIQVTNSAGTFNLDAFEAQSAMSTASLAVYGATFTGDYVDYVSRHPSLTYNAITGGVSSSVKLDSSPPYSSILRYIWINLPLTEAQVDRVLNGLATRSNPSWEVYKSVYLIGACSPPSWRGVRDKAIVEAQTGSPTVTSYLAITQEDIAIANIPAPTAKDNVIESLPPSMTRNNFGGYLGYEFTITDTQVLVSLSRPIGTTFTQNHKVVVWETLGETVVAEVIVTPSSAIDNGFAVGNLVTPVILVPGTYRVVSEEFVSGDTWQDYEDLTNYSSAISVDQGCWTNGYIYPFNLNTAPNKGYVWPGMQFAEPELSLSHAIAGDLLSTLTTQANVIEAAPSVFDRTDFAGTMGYEFTIDSPQVLMSLSRAIGGTFVQSHRVGVWKESDQSLVAEVTITTGSTVIDGYAVETLVTPVLLAAGAYRIGSEEFDGGDNWANFSAVSSYSDVISIVGEKYASGYNYPNLGPDTADNAYAWPGMQFAEPLAQIGWDNGAGFVPLENGVTAYGVYPAAKASGTVSIKYEVNQYPTTDPVLVAL